MRRAGFLTVHNINTDCGRILKKLSVPRSPVPTFYTLLTCQVWLLIGCTTQHLYALIPPVHYIRFPKYSQFLVRHQLYLYVHLHTECWVIVVPTGTVYNRLIVCAVTCMPKTIALHLSTWHRQKAPCRLPGQTLAWFNLLGWGGGKLPPHIMPNCNYII